MTHTPKRLLCAFSFIVAIASLPALASDGKQQEAMVTFYSHGNRWTTGLPGSNHGIFIGKVFSGRNALFSFLEGFPAKNNLVISFHFPPGEYTFSAAYGKPAPQKGISLTLAPGREIFLPSSVRIQGNRRD
jgi:hypothetical protein